MTTVSIEIPGMAVEELPLGPLESIRRTGAVEGMGAEVVELRGSADNVAAYVAEHWGAEEAELHPAIAGLVAGPTKES